MKVLSAVVFAILATCALSAGLRNSKIDLKRIENIKNNGWGKALLSLGQL
jgi:hypothetical protein